MSAPDVHRCLGSNRVAYRRGRARELLTRLQQARTRLTSPLAVREAAIAIARVLDLPIVEVAEVVEGCLVLMEIEMVTVPPETAKVALGAFDRYGKGRHPAQLNSGTVLPMLARAILASRSCSKAPVFCRLISRLPDRLLIHGAGGTRQARDKWPKA